MDSNPVTAAAPRLSYSPLEFAQVNGLSKPYVYACIKSGALVAHRVGGDGPLRILADDGERWLRGQRKPDDPPAIGVSPAKAARLAANRRGGNAAKQQRRARKRGAA